MLNADLFSSQFPGLSVALSSSELDALLAALQTEYVAAGETLITQGTPSDALYLVWDGSLDVEFASKRGGSLSRLGPGEVVGEVSLLDPGPATATVYSDAGCTVLVLRRVRLERLWNDHPGTAARFLAHLCRELAHRIRKTTIVLNRTRHMAAQEERPC
jgi:CRP-like cAMP-binding protein